MAGTFIGYVQSVDWDTSQLYRTHETDPAHRRLVFKITGRSAQLPLSMPEYSWMRNVLTLLFFANRAGYLEVDDEDTILRLWCADQGTALVDSLTDGSLVVHLEESAARYGLTPTNPAFQSLSGLLRASHQKRVVLAASDTGEILAASLDVLDLDAPGPAFADACEIDPADLAKVARAQVGALFDALSEQTCPLPNAAAGCIAFRFPDNGCWARAHAMCNQLRDDHGVEAGKAWVYGDLSAATDNRADCSARWAFHVAPFVRVGDEAGDVMVLDPSVFCGPVPLTDWRSAIAHADSRLLLTAPEIYQMTQPCQGVREGHGELTRNLQYFQACLIARGRGRIAPPPYADCTPCPNGP